MIARAARATARRLRSGTRSVLARTGPDLGGRALGGGFRVVAVRPHDASAFTEGLDWTDGALHESTGLYGASSVRRVDQASGRVLQVRRLPGHVFGEGLAVVGARIVQLTWREGVALVHDRTTLAPAGTVPYRGEGWGLCHDGRRLVASDGTSRLRFLDPVTLAETGTLDVRCDRRPVERLNDLTAMGDELVVNVLGEDRLARVCPDGAVVGWIDLRPLRQLPGLRGSDQVANGVAWDAAQGRLLVTGKGWPVLVEVAPPPACVPPARERTKRDGVERHGSIEDVPRAAWDALAGDDVLASHGWLATVEATRRDGARRFYLTVRRGTRLVGAVACVRTAPGDAAQTVDHVVFGRVLSLARRAGLSLLPGIACGPTRAMGCLPLVDPALGDVERARVLAELVDAIENEASRAGLPVTFSDVVAGDATLRTLLRARGYCAALDLPRNVLDVRWASFADYLHHLDEVTRGGRRDVRRQRNQNAKRGTSIVVLERPELEAERLHELLSLNEHAHNGRALAFTPELFAVAKRNLGDDAVVYSARKHGRLTATALLLRRGGRAVLPLVGVDHAATGSDFTFFNVAHYRPIADAIASGLATLSFGRGLDELKARRGCRLEETWIFHRAASRAGRGAVAVWFALLSSWNRGKRSARALARAVRHGAFMGAVRN